MNEVLENYLSKTPATGVLAGVNIDGVVETFSSGSISSDEHHRTFYIYSISKTFTAVAILQLCEELGDFLEQSVVEMLPHYEIPSEITVRQLLNHTSGLSDYFSQKEYQDAVQQHPEQSWSYEKLMQVGLRDTPLFPAGEGWFYSNPGYGMLRELIELKSGESYYDFIQQHIIAPLKLEHTRPFTEKDTAHHLLPSVDDSMAGDFRELYDPGWIATGCFISTVQEVSQFYQALFHGKLINTDSLQQMTQLVELKYPLPEPMVAAYGLGVMSAKHDPQGVHYGHGGGGPGYTTYARHFPDHNGKQITITLVVNASLPQTPFELADEIFASLGS